MYTLFRNRIVPRLPHTSLKVGGVCRVLTAVALALGFCACSSVEPDVSSQAPLLKTPSAWQIEDVDQRGIPDAANIHLAFQDDNKLVGSTGCNRLAGSFFLQGRELNIKQVVSTRRACVPALMDIENRLMNALAAVKYAELDRSSRLTLIDASGRTRLTLTERTLEDSKASANKIFTCQDGSTFSVSFYPRGATITTSEGIKDELKQVASASGSHYRNDRLDLRLKGQEARLARSESVQECSG